MAHEHLADLLDLDAEVLSEYHRQVAEWVSATLTERARVIDVGAGTGTGTLALARQLPDAEVIALDADEEMLKHIQDKARASGLADRIRTVQADLDQAWPAGLKTADLVWAANSLHHLGDPARAVAQVYQMLRPGGLLAVTELDFSPTRRAWRSRSGSTPPWRGAVTRPACTCMRTGLPVSPKPGSRSSPNAAS
jgi:ubiquinone/menaquinone biosynthesis C-methylase UbiE